MYILWKYLRCLKNRFCVIIIIVISLAKADRLHSWKFSANILFETWHLKCQLLFCYLYYHNFTMFILIMRTVHCHVRIIKPISFRDFFHVKARYLYILNTFLFLLWNKLYLRILNLSGWALQEEVKSYLLVWRSITKFPLILSFCFPACF